MIALMKLTSSIYCEVILILMLSMVDDIGDIIKDFVALGFIVEIDNYFALNLKGYDTEETVMEYSEKLVINPT